MSTLTNMGPSNLPDPEARLARVPWSALDGLGPMLADPLAQVLSGQRRAERALDALLRAHKSFSAAQRQVTAESLFGVALWQRRLKSQCALAEPTALQLLATLARDLGGAPEAPRWLQVDLPPSNPVPTDWRDRWSVPDALADLLEQQGGPEAEQLARSLNVPGSICLRANLLKTTREKLQRRLRDEGVETEFTRFALNGLLVRSERPNILALDSFRDGDFEVQDEGSQLLVQFAAVQRGESVLDVCAGAGGKTLQLCSELGAPVHATDADVNRLERLRTRASKAGAHVVIHGRQLSTPKQFDVVLVDAPCSEWGALRRGPDARWRIDLARLSEWPTTQHEILNAAAQHVRPGGRLVYATCTWRPEENEQVVSLFLKQNQQFSLSASELATHVSPDAAPYLKLFPHRQGTDGFFAALLQRH